jgi:hypothetical protein
MGEVRAYFYILLNPINVVSHSSFDSESCNPAIRVRLMGARSQFNGGALRGPLFAGRAAPRAGGRPPAGPRGRARGAVRGDGPSVGSVGPRGAARGDGPSRGVRPVGPRRIRPGRPEWGACVCVWHFRTHTRDTPLKTRKHRTIWRERTQKVEKNLAQKR